MGSDPYFFRIRTQGYGYGKITGTGENSKEGTEYGMSSEVFKNTKYGYGTMTDFFLNLRFGKTTDTDFFSKQA